MVDDFFPDVTGPIPFGGLDSTDPLAFKVYQPDRLVLGTRMEDHLRPGVCFWHSFAWPGVDMFGSGTMDRPWLDGQGDEMAAARTKMAVAFEFFTKLGIPYYCFHDRDVAPGRHELRDVPFEPRCARRRCRRLPGADRRPLAVGDRQPVHPPALSGGRGHQSRSRGLRLRRRAGQAHAGDHQSPRRRELRPVGRPRGVRHPAQHGPSTGGRAARPIPASRRRAQAPDRVPGPAPHRTQADGADQAPVRLRRRDGPRLPDHARPRG